ncbi:MAG TPA: hypothetical protein VH372_11180 [Actinospica sp.]|nr:hypothetical protein [Actinospica sp.]
MFRLLLGEIDLESALTQLCEQWRAGAHGDQQADLAQGADRGEAGATELARIRRQHMPADGLQHPYLHVGFGNIDVGDTGVRIDAAARRERRARVDGLDDPPADRVGQ